MEVALYRGAEEFSAEVTIDPETGEIGTDVPLDMLVYQNPIGTIAYILTNAKRCEMFDSRIAELVSARKSMVKNADRARASLLSVMQATGVEAIRSDDGTFAAKLQRERDASVEIFEDALIPNAYRTDPPPVPPSVPDKRLMMAAMKDGHEIPGARIVKRDRLVIK